MEVLRVDPSNPERRALDAAAEAVLRGGVIAFPTDAFYNLGCSLFDVMAVDLITRLKRRQRSLAVTALIPDPAQAWGLALEVPPLAARLIQHGWPGSLSIILRAAAIVPKSIQSEAGTIALRCPKDPLSLALLARVGGPVVSSSANLTGQPPANDAQEVVAVFGNQLDLVLDGGPRTGGIPSTLVDMSGDKPRLLRRGEFDVRSLLGDHEDLTERRSA